MELYPYKFVPVYKEKIWGGRNLARLYGRALPAGNIGESWELADLAEGVSRVAEGPAAGASLTELTRTLGARLLGRAEDLADGRFPLLVKLLDANGILSLQVHPDERAASEIPGAALKTECWYIVESRDGFIYKGVHPGVTAEAFRRAAADDTVEKLVRRMDVATGDFHYLPAGMVHALGAGVVVAEVQTPSDTTYRVTDWGRGRRVHVDRSLQCIRFELDDALPGANGETLLTNDYFAVARRTAASGKVKELPPGRCVAVMLLSGRGEIAFRGGRPVALAAGDTVLLPADLAETKLAAGADCRWLEVTLPERP